MLLVSKYMDRTLCSAEYEELQQRLSQDACCRDVLVAMHIQYQQIKESANEFCFNPYLSSHASDSNILNEAQFRDINLILECLAEDENFAPAMELPEENPNEENISGRRRRKPISNKDRFLFLFKAAAIVLVAMSVVLLDRWLGQLIHAKKERYIARISRGVDAEWQEVSGRIDVGSSLYAGPLTLKKGFAEIVMDSGARLLLEAPVELDLETSSRIYLDKGRLVANIAQLSEERFVVRTANSTVVDYGTEFGVEVDPSGRTYAQVFQGKVELRQGSDPLKYEKKLRLRAGQAGSVEHSGGLFTVDAGNRRFITTMPSRYELVVKKTRPLYYWRFDRDRGGLLREEMSHGLNEAYRLYGALNYTDGPDLGGDKNIGLHLTGLEEDYAILRHCNSEADDSDAVTIMMWVRPEKSDSPFKNNVIMRFRPKSGAGIGGRRALGFDKKNRFYFHFYAKPNGSMGDNGKTVIRSNPVRINRWYHIVVSYTNNDHLRIYVNGQLEARQPFSGQVGKSNDETQWCIGLANRENLFKHASFEGSLDEICHYNRELSAGEVRMLYKASGTRR